MCRFIPWQLEPFVEIRERRQVEAEEALLRTAGAMFPDDVLIALSRGQVPLPRWFFGDDTFCAHPGAERRQQRMRVAVDRRKQFPHGRRLNRGEAVGWCCDVDSSHAAKCGETVTNRIPRPRGEAA